MEALISCMSDNKVSFETLIRCYNFWDALPPAQRRKYLQAYEEGKVPNSGPYGCQTRKKVRTRRDKQGNIISRAGKKAKKQ